MSRSNMTIESGSRSERDNPAIAGSPVDGAHRWLGGGCRPGRPGVRSPIEEDDKGGPGNNNVEPE